MKLDFNPYSIEDHNILYAFIKNKTYEYLLDALPKKYKPECLVTVMMITRSYFKGE
jgi:hypothetical protein